MSDITIQSSRPLRIFRRTISAALTAPLLLTAILWAIADPCEQSPLDHWPIVALVVLPYVATLVALYFGRVPLARRLGITWATVLICLFVYSVYYGLTFEAGRPDREATRSSLVVVWLKLGFVVGFFFLNGVIVTTGFLAAPDNRRLRELVWTFVGLLASFPYLTLCGHALLGWVPEEYEAAYAIHADENAVILSLRTINKMLGKDPRGFSPTLEYLHMVTVDHPHSPERKIIESLPTDQAGRYRFVYGAGPRDERGHIVTYTLEARPIQHQRGSCCSFFTDQTGVIRRTAERRAATARDPQVD